MGSENDGKEFVGKEVTVELKNNLAIRGILHSGDQYLNIKLENMRLVDQDKYPHMGLLDQQFNQLLMLEEDGGEFLVEVIKLFFDDSKRMISELSSLIDQPVVDFQNVGSFVHQLKGSSSSLLLPVEQAACFANPLPVKLLPVIIVYDCKDNKGVTISELADYPLKTLLFTSQNLESLVGLVAEICSILQKVNNVVFNLLFSDCATKVFLFPQVNLPAAGSHLSTWECGGYFIYNKISKFHSASEAELSERLAAASLDDQGFHALKQLCYSIDVKIAPCI
ncbi:uncharacterized protein A4U43_C07F27550 [Asparagus officinalis]|uniref:Sm domain-containing protein n=1 Tax=Asparagus officinalis TaxID=4686 RepID=A0A5P1EHA9_ASPOF|nr:uncharacterized protein A4U43_C07F27550 [Asparagus officinalis]